jgi:hypothetical protein
MVLEKIQAEYGFIGVHGIDLESGLTLPISGETEYVSILLKKVFLNFIKEDLFERNYREKWKS